MFKRNYVKFILLCFIFFSACATTHKVARAIKLNQPCEPRQEIFQDFACSHYKFCSGHAIIIDFAWSGDGYYIAPYNGASAFDKMISIDWLHISKRLCDNP